MKCPYCERRLSSFSTRTVRADRTGEEPHEIPVLAIYCPYCEMILGVLNLPRNERY